ncbi:MAG: truB [Gammaproteobacteria bacterium]|jgi:tRNA pseudouridine55 synthase|nr:truB [Gammaproteobacteria bacterium]
MHTKKPVHGILLLDKPIGLSSNQALQKAKRVLGAQKAGHTGSLDPMATGLLPICFGEASKFAQYGLSADKAYHAVMKLGVSTTTADAMGEVLAEYPVPEITSELLSDIQLSFKGEQMQTPPMYSALKQNGVPLYRLARQGVTVEREERNIYIYDLHLKQMGYDHISFHVACSKGTYVRTLAEDIAKALGTAAHLVELRRTRVGHLEGPMVTLEALANSYHMEEVQANVLLPVDALITHLPKLVVDKATCQALFQGKMVFHEGDEALASANAVVRLYTENDQFFGVGRMDATNYLQSERLVSAEYLNEIL